MGKNRLQPPNKVLHTDGARLDRRTLDEALRGRPRSAGAAGEHHGVGRAAADMLPLQSSPATGDEVDLYVARCYVPIGDTRGAESCTVACTLLRLRDQRRRIRRTLLAGP